VLAGVGERSPRACSPSKAGCWAAGRSTSSATAGCATSTTWRDGASTAGVTQVGHDTPGRVYYQRKIAEGKSKKEALHALKRRISDAVWRQLQVDLGRR
jgi:hypothetical protein